MEKLVSKLKQSKVLQIFTISIRYLLGSSFVYASIFKIQGKSFLPGSEESTTNDPLSRFFAAMHQSGLYWQFIGWGQLIAGFLLMSQIFSTLGAVAFFTMMLNIFIITISFKSDGILFITFVMLLVNIYLLLWDWNKLKFVALPKPQNYIDNDAEFSKRRVWTYLGMIYFLIVISLRMAMIGTQTPGKSKVADPAFSINFVVSGVILMLSIWVITIFFQLRKK